MIDLNEIEAAIEACKRHGDREAPWDYEYAGYEGTDSRVRTASHPNNPEGFIVAECSAADAQLIVLLFNAAPQLIAELRQLRKERK